MYVFNPKRSNIKGGKKKKKRKGRLVVDETTPWSHGVA
jgi:hypothetical protein